MGVPLSPLALLLILIVGVQRAQGAKQEWRLTPFLDELPRTPQLHVGFEGRDQQVAHLRLEARAGLVQLHRELPRPTRIWGYQGIFPGPTVVVNRDRALNVTWVNALPLGDHALPVETCMHGPDAMGKSARMVPHLHGAIRVRPEYDGQPSMSFGPGEQRSYLYSNSQGRGATLWYHG
jgi:spore coat protein A